MTLRSKRYQYITQYVVCLSVEFVFGQVRFLMMACVRRLKEWYCDTVVLHVYVVTLQERIDPSSICALEL